MGKVGFLYLLFTLPGRNVAYGDCGHPVQEQQLLSLRAAGKAAKGSPEGACPLLVVVGMGVKGETRSKGFPLRVFASFLLVQKGCARAA